MTYYQIIKAIFISINKNIIIFDDFIYELINCKLLPLGVSFDINIIKSHTWNFDKDNFINGNTESFHCKNCKINFINMINNGFINSLTCKEQIIKNIIE